MLKKSDQDVKMRIFLFMSDERLYQTKIFERLAAALKDQIAGIVVIPAVSVKRNLWEFIKDYIIMLGPTLFMVKSILTYKMKILDRCARYLGRKNHYSIDAIAKENLINVFHTDNLNDEEFIRQLEKLNLDVIISVSQPQIIKKKLLAVPKLGIINVHPGMLPKYRGPAPYFWALMNDEPYFGLTTHYMDEEIDNGPILLQKLIPISPKDSYNSLTKKTMEEVPAIILETLEKIESKDYKTIVNDKTKATYCHYPNIIEAFKFRIKGKKTI
jgi:methionyl-tRNA formyltransferase